ncbi:fumarylacetoacetate hydrolase family protein, partial [Myxococcus sp. CA039A]|nr:fumarylacetoacetate hydrolase family protein [Myxococcus sp. CA039A]
MLESQGVIRAEQIAEAYIPANMVEFLQGGQQSLQLAKQAIEYVRQNEAALKYKAVHPTSDVKLEAPVLNPGKMICVGHNYREHILEMGRGLPPVPVVFAKFSNTIIGPQDDIPFFPISEQLDYEAEFAFVIGKRARNVSQDQA